GGLERETEPQSDIAAALRPVHGPAGTGDQARLVRAEERDDVRHLLGSAEAAQRDLPLDERRDAFRVGLLTAPPGPSLEQDRPRGHRVDGHTVPGDLPGKRLHEADLRRLGDVVRGWSTRLPAVDRGNDHDPAPAAIAHSV